MLRHLTLWSERLGLTGRADVIEVWENELVPVEYKIGVRHGIAAHVQLCAQAMCLEEMFGVRVVRGGLWFASQRRRVDVVIDAALRNTTLEVIVAVHQLRAASQLPAAVDDERCSQCQLRAECMPGVVKRPDALRRYMTAEVWSCGS